MKVYNTADVNSQFTSILLYGLAGAGKTPLAASLPDPIIITSEPGLKSLQQYNLPYVVGRDYAEGIEVHKWLIGSNEARRYQSVFYDSISATSENVLAAEKKKSGDPRKFSPETTGKTMEIVRLYLGITGKHVIMTCKALEKIDQITGAKSVEPFAVVPKLGPALPYLFDNVLYLSRTRDAISGREALWLCCQYNEFAYGTRNRSGLLDLWEPGDLSHIIRKSNGVR